MRLQVTAVNFFFMCVLVNCVCHLLGFQTASYAPLMYLKVSTTQRFHLQNAPLQPPHFPTPSLHQSPYPTSPPILLPHSPSPPLPHSLIPNPLLLPPSLPYSPTPSLQPLTPPPFSHLLVFITRQVMPWPVNKPLTCDRFCINYD